MLIEAKLKQLMDFLLARRQAFTKNEVVEDELRSDLLRDLLEDGWAEMQMRNGKPTWVATHYMDVVRNRQIELATMLNGNAAEKAQQAKLTGSLKIMLTAFAERARKEQLARGEEGEPVTADTVLLMLARSGKVQLRAGFDGKAVWVPFPGAFEDFNEMIFGHRTIGIRMDDILEHRAQNRYNLCKALVEGDVRKDDTSLAMLQALENAGDAIAYRDVDGALAWRASKQLRRSYRRGKMSTR